MENTKQIIRSGIVEQFVLGLTTDAESQRVKNYIKKYPEVRAYALQVRAAMNKIVEQHDIPPRRTASATRQSVPAKTWLNGLMLVLILITLIVQIAIRF